MSKTKQTQASAGSLGETVRTIVYAVLIAVGIRSFLYEPFNIPSESMLPTLLVGDYLFVSKFSYGYSKYSLPFSLPLIPGHVLERFPQRGDVAVFKFPRDNSTDYIKRIIGLPGDRIQVKASELYLNDVKVPRKRVEDFTLRGRPVAQYIETLPNGVSYRTLDLRDDSDTDNTGVFTVPPGFVFAMGDNRDNSSDSRVSPADGGVGFVPAINLEGRADFMFFSTDGSAAMWEFWKWPFATRFSRMFRTIALN